MHNRVLAVCLKAYPDTNRTFIDGLLENGMDWIVSSGFGILLKRAADLREDVAGVGADQADGAHDDDEDHREHHGVFGDVLTFFIGPELVRAKIAK